MKTKTTRVAWVAWTWALAVHGAVMVTPSTDTSALQTALNAQGLTITSVNIDYGIDGQFGTYSNFNVPPITIADGIVLSSGNVSFIGGPPDPELAAPEPSYDMGYVSSPEFESYGPGHIENFFDAYDVASLRVDFLLETNSQVKFDFIFGSVEYPYWTSEFTDALLVFLDGTDPTNQIATDANGQPVQVGVSFSGLVTSSDQNTAFADPHGLLRKLTTTTAMLPAGPHTLRFEVGDVNDQMLDSAAFIANLRAGDGTEGTGLSDPPPVLSISGWRSDSGTNYLQLSWTNSDVSVVLESADDVTGPWTETPLVWTTNLNLVVATATNNASTQFFRLREE